MALPNPYDPPRAPTSSADQHLAGKARRLLQRRHEPVSVARLLHAHWRRHTLIAVLLGVLCLLAWGDGNFYLTIALAAFWAGQMVRDLQWYRTVVVEWDSTKELLDWEKIERLAA